MLEGSNNNSTLAGGATATTLTYDNTFLNAPVAGKGNGKLRLAAGGLGWKDAVNGQVTTIPSADFLSLTWLRSIKGHQLRILCKDGKLYIFDGLSSSALEELKDFCREQYGLGVEVKELTVKGWNWGKLSIDGSVCEFKLDNDNEKIAFDIPLTCVNNAVVATKDEITIEFIPPEVTDKKVDSVVEMRFHVPTKNEGEGDEGGEVEGELDSKEDNNTDFNDLARSLCAKIKGFAEINNSNVSGDVVVTIPDLPCLVPRGRFELDMSVNYLRLHGKSYDHKILYNSIVKSFLLPKPDDIHVFLVLALDPPIRQGLTRYPFVVFQFNKDDIVEDVEVQKEHISPELLSSKYDGKLLDKYEGPLFEVCSTLLRILAGQKIIVASTSFRSTYNGNSSSVKCALKANEGFLYPLERNFLFLPKPVTLLPHSEISMVEFSRTGAALGNPRTFDLKFILKTGSPDISFSNIAKEEQVGLEEFFKLKGIEIKFKDSDGLGNGVGRSKEDRRKRSYSDDDDDLEGGEDGSSPDEDYQADESDDSVDEEYTSNDEGSVSGSGSGSGSDEEEDDDEEEEEDEE